MILGSKESQNIGYFRNRRIRVLIAIGALTSLILIGTISYTYLEDWNLIQAFYFSVVTIMTIGYGDLQPTTDISRLFTAFYILAGVTAAVSAVGLISSTRFEIRSLKDALSSTDHEIRKVKRTTSDIKKETKELKEGALDLKHDTEELMEETKELKIDTEVIKETTREIEEDRDNVSL
jgi:methyl-accepting chemotaxis protein